MIVTIVTARRRILYMGYHLTSYAGIAATASESAFGIFSDTLRLELRPFGIRVSTIEPGAIKTPAVNKTLGDIDAVIRDLPASGAAQYGAMLKQFAGAHMREK